MTSSESLAAALARVGSPVELLRNLAFPPSTFPVQPEFTNWRSEQRSWLETCALLDQSHHMTDLFVEGPDALRLLQRPGRQQLRDLRPRQGQAVRRGGPRRATSSATPSCSTWRRSSFDLVGHPMVIDWVTFHLERGDYEATAERDDNSVVRASGPPKLYRYELQGPTAAALIEQVTGAPVPDVKFFNMAEFTIAGRRVRGLRHGMAGQPGFELFGPWDGRRRGARPPSSRPGEDHGLVRVGAKAYSTANLGSGLGAGADGRRCSPTTRSCTSTASGCRSRRSAPSAAASTPPTSATTT